MDQSLSMRGKMPLPYDSLCFPACTEELGSLGAWKLGSWLSVDRRYNDTVCDRILGKALNWRPIGEFGIGMFLQAVV
jgi:hypothetical protein